MLYPINIEIKEKNNKILNKIKDIIPEVKRKAIYIIFDRKNLIEKIAVKLHI